MCVEVCVIYAYVFQVYLCVSLGDILRNLAADFLSQRGLVQSLELRRNRRKERRVEGAQHCLHTFFLKSELLRRNEALGENLQGERKISKKNLRNELTHKR